MRTDNIGEIEMKDDTKNRTTMTTKKDGTRIGKIEEQIGDTKNRTFDIYLKEIRRHNR